MWRIGIFCLIAGISVFLYGDRSFADKYEWEDVSSGIDRTVRLTCIEGVDGSGVLYAGTSDGVYRTNDFGGRWERMTLPGREENVTELDFFGDTLYAATGSGLYIRCEGEWSWSSGKQYLYGVTADIIDGEPVALVWTGTEIFIVEPSGWKRIDPRTPGEKIEDVAVSGSIIYAAAGNKLYFSRDRGNSWDRYFVCRDAGEETEHSDDEEEIKLLPAIRKICPARSGAVVSTGAGIFLFHDGIASVNRIDTAGLPSSQVIFALEAADGIFAATSKKVFFRGSGGESWCTVFENGAAGDIVWLDMLTDAYGHMWLWVAAEHAVYRLSMQNIHKERPALPSPEGRKERLVGEPTILDVQQMAIRYAEVSPEKIKRWRTGAKWKAVMPRLSVNFSRSDNDNVEIYKSASTAYIVEGPREVDNDWGVALTWDLADLIWNSEQTSIDVRSKLMVQLRDDILEEVTRLYFERKRIIAELNAFKEPDVARRKVDDRIIRVQELTAYIDAFTGGGFSEALNRENM